MYQNLRTRESGFTLIEVLVVVIIVAILAAVAFPIYQNYVKGAYASDAQSAIGSIWNAAQMYYQDRGEWPDDVTTQLEPKYISMKSATTRQWVFTIIGGGDGISQITALSTEEMKQGAGHEVIYLTETGKFSGYGFDEEK
ncbi:MAG: prepilin-type N-terminal cleavage/methylation domain-containing protein [Candidatus Marinimicrobia bacterium]|nr:prepilin-type N-terminal cleavage/methylation domain-containing protein [Candidatus Neomarinimicrobiota bacterium]